MHCQVEQSPIIPSCLTQDSFLTHSGFFHYTSRIRIVYIMSCFYPINSYFIEKKSYYGF